MIDTLALFDNRQRFEADLDPASIGDALIDAGLIMFLVWWMFFIVNQ